MEVVILAIVVVVLVLGVAAGAGVVRARRRAVDLEPPATPPGSEAAPVATTTVEAPPEPVVEVPTAAAPAPGVDVAGPPAAPPGAPPTEAPPVVPEVAPGTAPAAPVRPRFRDRLTKARNRFTGALSAIRGARLDDEVWDDLEAALLGADVGVHTTTELLAGVRATAAEQSLTEGTDVVEVLRSAMVERLGDADRSLAHAPSRPTVWLLVGVNGVGKTTTAGKLAHQATSDGQSVMLAAGDTFRAAAAEQLTAWAERTGAQVVRGADGSDPSSVVFDAIEAADARNCDLVVADTAGRLHTKSNLMEELGKVRRVADKGAGTVTEVLLVLDATTGQNGLVQARQFTDAVELTGVVLTKLDGSAKGGIVFAIQSELGIPVKLVGLGEQAEDLVAFDAREFVDALFD